MSQNFCTGTYELKDKPLTAFEQRMKKKNMKAQRFPKGWNEERVQKVISFYESQTEEEAVAEDESAFEDLTHTFMEVPKNLVPAIRELIAKSDQEGSIGVY